VVAWAVLPGGRRWCGATAPVLRPASAVASLWKRQPSKSAHAAGHGVDDGGTDTDIRRDSARCVSPPSTLAGWAAPLASCAPSAVDLQLSFPLAASVLATVPCVRLPFQACGTVSAQRAARVQATSVEAQGCHL
jgi:hypothetical protein